MKAFMLCTQTGGTPNIDFEATSCHGWVQCGTIDNVGGYIFSGTGPQLLAIDGLPNVIGIVAVTESGNVRWGELDGKVPLAVRTKVNTWLTNHGYPTIPAGWSYRQVLQAVWKRLNPLWDIWTHDVMDAP